MQRMTGGLYAKRYIFNVRDDDGRSHFTPVSREFPDLTFVLTWDYSGDDEIGSSRIQNGRCKTRLMSFKYMESVYDARGVDFDNFDDESWFNYCEARIRFREEAEDWWLDRILKEVRTKPRRSG
jgi:hypothetical protein